ncbi:MAG: hypothetical protein K1X67_24595 [Fimbriimonadaceae bacterium]|nr:hypothetical protein [Fimbriimonadaceae bacterium]
MTKATLELASKLRVISEELQDLRARHRKEAEAFAEGIREKEEFGRILAESRRPSNLAP